MQALNLALFHALAAGHDPQPQLLWFAAAVAENSSWLCVALMGWAVWRHPSQWALRDRRAGGGRCGLGPGPRAGRCLRHAAALHDGPEPGPHRAWRARLAAERACVRDVHRRPGLPAAAAAARRRLGVAVDRRRSPAGHGSTWAFISRWTSLAGLLLACAIARRAVGASAPGAALAARLYNPICFARLKQR